jgi:AbrB family looped-hinge helix DNA binding protein
MRDSKAAGNGAILRRHVTLSRILGTAASLADLPARATSRIILSGSMITWRHPMAKEVKLGRVQQRGQVTIPIELRRKLGIEEGGVVAFTETENGIVISPQQVLAMDALDRVGRVLKEQGISLEELIESGREIRAEMVQEEYGLDAEDGD